MRWLLALWLGLAMVGTGPTLAQETYEEPAEDEERVSFRFRLADDRGGGRVEVLAGDFEYQEGAYFLGTGGVTIKYGDLQLQADVVRIDIPTDLMTAEGGVVLDEGPSRLVGETLEYNLSSRTGRVTDATAYVDSSYVFMGDEIRKVDGDTYTLDNGTFTSCSEENPPWSLAMGSAEITVENYARIRNARMKLKKAPVLYVPYMVWPTKTERSSGFLVPQPGYSTRRGFELSLAYFQTLGRSADTTFYADLSTEDFFAIGNEFRYRPTENTQGYFEGFFLQDQDFKRLGELTEPLDFVNNSFTNDDLPDENRWKLHWYHETTDLWGGFKAVVNVKEFSDPTYQQDFERSVRRQTNNFIYSQAYLTRNFGQQSLNILVDMRERIQTTTFADPGENEDEDLRRVGRITDTRRQLPEIEYRLRPTQLGSTPLYFSLDGNLHFLSVDNPQGSNALGESSYERADLFPSFSLPLSTLPWLSVKVDLGGRATYYSNSINRATRRFFNDESRDDPADGEDEEALDRTVAVAGAELVGPSFSRIFEKKNPGRFSKFKHIIEPRFVYRYLDNFSDPDEDEGLVPSFDEIDRQLLRNEVTVSFINRILAKPTDEEEGGGFEIASFELQQAYSYDDEMPLQRGNNMDGMLEEDDAGPLRAIFRYNPSAKTSFKTEAAYNTLFGQMRSVSLSGSTQVGHHTIGGSLFTRWGTAEGADVTSNQARLSASLALVPGRLTFDANLNVDIEESEILQQRYFFDYQGTCYSLRLELRESTFADVRDRDFRFAFTLKNVGTFIDLNGSLN